MLLSFLIAKIAKTHLEVRGFVKMINNLPLLVYPVIRVYFGYLYNR